MGIEIEIYRNRERKGDLDRWGEVDQRWTGLRETEIEVFG